MLSIGAVERDTGIARDTLRIWERRYGFPIPQRNRKKERVYSLQQVKRLQLIKRLLDNGCRPGKVVMLSDTELLDIAKDTLFERSESAADPSEFRVFLDCISHHDGAELNRLMELNLLQQGLERFILETMEPLVSVVGDQWSNGTLEIYEEHFFTRQITQFLDMVMCKMPVSKQQQPLLLSTLPNEPHCLGLLMLECLLRNRGFFTVNLGTEVPIQQLVLAIKNYEVGAVFLSFSSGYHSNSIRSNIIELAQQVPTYLPIWVGGSGVKKMRKLPQQIVIRHQLQEVLKFKLTS